MYRYCVTGLGYTIDQQVPPHTSRLQIRLSFEKQWRNLTFWIWNSWKTVLKILNGAYNKNRHMQICSIYSPYRSEKIITEKGNMKNASYAALPRQLELWVLKWVCEHLNKLNKYASHRPFLNTYAPISKRRDCWSSSRREVQRRLYHFR
jgi:hypothetical protein